MLTEEDWDRVCSNARSFPQLKPVALAVGYELRSE
jgi:hypothetical protein